jgi:hypothetical protein
MKVSKPVSPIIFSAPMVRALLDGNKTQTRRLAWVQPKRADKPKPSHWGAARHGDLLYVREAWQLHERFTDVGTIVYAATIDRAWSETHEQFPASLFAKIAPIPFQRGWRSPLHHLRATSRITLEVNGVRLQRLQEISEADAIAEGCVRSQAGYYCGRPHPAHGAPKQFNTAREAFEDLWKWLHGEDAWRADPLVIALAFAVHRANVDQLVGARKAGP